MTFRLLRYIAFCRSDLRPGTEQTCSFADIPLHSRFICSFPHIMLNNPGKEMHI